LTDREDNAVCPIKWLLIHASRNGCADGTSIEEILQKAFERKDKSVVWPHPEWPVLPSFTASACFLDFTKPALHGQVWSTVRLGGLLAGLLALIAPHDVRRGCFADMANLSVAPAGVPMERVAETMGHSHKAYEAGLTKKYAGSVSDPTLLQKRVRAEVDETDVLLSSNAGPYKKTKFSDQEIDDRCRKEGLDHSVKRDRATARRHLDAQQLEEWLEKEKNASSGGVYATYLLVTDMSLTADSCY
jgi:hypothetical protein